jgi:hypothetical protein
MDFKGFYKKDIELLVPGSSQIIKNIGIRKKLAPISPKERVLIIQCPQLNKKARTPYFRSGELYLKKKDEEIEKIKQMLEISVERIKSQKARPLIYPNRTPDPHPLESLILNETVLKSPVSLKSRKNPVFFPLTKFRKRTLLNRAPILMITNKLKKQIFKPEYKDANISTETPFEDSKEPQEIL